MLINNLNLIIVAQRSSIEAAVAQVLDRAWLVSGPEKGVDVFDCNRVFRDRLLAMSEANSSLVGKIFWLGFRRTEVMYERREC